MPGEPISIIEPNITSLRPKPNLDQDDLSRLIEVVNNAMWIVDSELKLVAQNNMAGEMLGWSDVEVIGASLYRLTPTSEVASHPLCQMIARVIVERQIVAFDEAVWLPRKKGRPILVEGRVAPILQGGEAAGAICAFWEVSPEKGQTYLHFEFANMASHLLRTPLSFIQASTEFLLNADLKAEEQRAILSKMRLQSQRLTDFTNELLKLLRLEIEQINAFIEAVALLPLIERVLSLIQLEKPRHMFSFLKDSSFPVVAADAIKVELILLNLLLNAVKRCPAGGHIIVEFEMNQAEVIISVKDDGESIPAEQLARVFWQFYPVDGGNNKMPSTYNLGLYNTKRLVELQNGRIWAESWPGQGSQFSFSLPIWEQNI